MGLTGWMELCEEERHKTNFREKVRHTERQIGVVEVERQSF